MLAVCRSMTTAFACVFLLTITGIATAQPTTPRPKERPTLRAPHRGPDLEPVNPFKMATRTEESFCIPDSTAGSLVFFIRNSGLGVAGPSTARVTFLLPKLAEGQTATEESFRVSIPSLDPKGLWRFVLPKPRYCLYDCPFVIDADWDQRIAERSEDNNRAWGRCSQ